MGWLHDMDMTLAAGDVAHDVEEARLQAMQRAEGAAGCTYGHVHPAMSDVIFCEADGTWPSADFCRNDCDGWEPPC